MSQRILVAVGLVSIVCFSFCAWALQSPVPASIAGRITQLGSDRPIAGAQVTLIAPARASSAAPSPARPEVFPGLLPTAISDADGKFELKGLQYGEYGVRISAEGYVRQDYGQKSFPGQGSLIALTTDRPSTTILVHLTPTGSVSGNITDLEGRPAVGVPVQLLRPAFNEEGLQKFQVIGSAKSDDRGAYRMYWISPGRYYLAAGTALTLNRPFDISSASPNELVTQSFGLSFYPRSSNIDNAVRIDIRPEVDLGINMVVPRQHFVTVRGHVVDSRTGLPPKSVNVGLGYLSVAGVTGIVGGSLGNVRNYDGASGAFELRDVMPGNYYAQVAVLDPDPSNVSGVARPRPSGQIALPVTTSDVDGVMLTATSGVSVQGQFIIEGQLADRSILSGLRIQLKPFADGIPVMAATGPVTQKTVGDGKFQIEGVKPEDYRLVVTIPESFYLKAATFNQRDVLNQPLHIEGADPGGTLDVVLSNKTGQINGQAMDGQKEAVSGATAVLVPTQHPNRFDLFKSAVTDSYGHFQIPGVAPGEYRLFVWDAIEPFSWFDPLLIKEVEAQSQVVRVAEFGIETVQARTIQIGR